MSVKPYQFEPLGKCPGNVKEDCRDEGETLSTAEYSRCYLKVFF